MEDYPRYLGEDLRQFARQVFLHYEMTEDDAAIAAEVIVDADLRGIDSHGLAHLTTHKSYSPGLKSAMVNPKPKPRIIRETPTTAVVDSDAGFGMVVAYRAMEMAIRKAKENSIGIVVVTKGHHLGAAGYYSMMALPHDMIGISMTNTWPAVPPTLGREQRLGTNPISLAAPTNKEPPFVLDMATSVVAQGKLEIARRKGASIPAGWAVDEDGNPITDPNDYWKGGALNPLGSTPELSSYKGYGLAVMVDILAGVLSGVGYGATLSSEERISGFFFAAIRIDSFRPIDEFKAMMDDMIRTLRDTPPAPGEERVLVAGLKEHETFQERSKHGIPLHSQVVDSLKELAQELGLPFPPPH